jgi:uncharacterized protein (DUF3820 family)
MDLSSKEYKLYEFPFGKYKGERISECNSLSYLEWLFESAKLDDKTRQVIGLRIYQLTNPKAYRK